MDSAPPSPYAGAVKNPVGASGGGSAQKSEQIQRSLSIARDTGFTTFTAGIRAGWKNEICSKKFRQVRARVFARAGVRCGGGLAGGAGVMRGGETGAAFPL